MTKKERIAALEAEVAALKTRVSLFEALLGGKQDKQPVYHPPQTWPTTTEPVYPWRPPFVFTCNAERTNT